MAYEIPSFTLGTLPANVDMSAEAFQYTGVDIGAAIAPVSGTGIGGAALVAASAGSPVLGILQNRPKANEAGTVMCDGVTKARAGGTVTVGDYVKVGTGGKIVTSNKADSIGRALESAVNGDIFTVILRALA